MKTSSRKRKTAVKKVAKVSKKRAKPAPPKKPVKSVKRVKPAPGSARAGAAADIGPRYFWMFAFFSADGSAPIQWNAAWGGVPRIPTPPKEPGDPPGPTPVDPGTPDLVPRFLEGISPKIDTGQEESLLFLIESPVFSTEESATEYIRGTEQGSYLFRRSTNCALFQID